MTRSATILSKLLFFGMPAIAIIPNLILWYTEGLDLIQGLASVLLPFGLYWLIMSSAIRIGRCAVWFAIVLLLAAFEIVLLYLYGNSVISVDMWMNLFTTNSSEAGELLNGLWPIIGVMCVLSLPLVAIGVIALVKKWRVSGTFLCVNRRIGLMIASTGAVLCGVGYFAGSPVVPHNQVFPINALYNSWIATQRAVATMNYDKSSGTFEYRAESWHCDIAPEVYVLVVGETSRADNWQLFGYERKTTPGIMDANGLVGFRKAMSESNVTHKSVPLLLSPVSSESFGDSIYFVKSVITAFKEAGFHTAFISNHRRNHSFIDFFGSEADTCIFVKEITNDDSTPDMEMLSYVTEEMQRGRRRLMIVLHTYGSHFKYNERYPRYYARFKPDRIKEVGPEGRQRLLNSYDNTIAYTADLLTMLMNEIEGSGYRGALLYTADHGEDLFDDGSNKFLHASPRPSYYQLHVPFIVWLSSRYIEAYPHVLARALENRDKNVSSSASFFHTALELADIRTPWFNPALSVVNTRYTLPQRVFLNDRNHGVLLRDAGLNTGDYTRLDSAGIKY